MSATAKASKARIAELEATVAVLIADRVHLAKLLAEYAIELAALTGRGAA